MRIEWVREPKFIWNRSGCKRFILYKYYYFIYVVESNVALCVVRCCCWPSSDVIIILDWLLKCMASDGGSGKDTALKCSNGRTNERFTHCEFHIRTTNVFAKNPVVLSGAECPVNSTWKVTGKMLWITLFACTESRHMCALFWKWKNAYKKKWMKFGCNRYFCGIWIWFSFQSVLLLRKML